MLIELTPAERHAAEVALPQIFSGGFHPQRIDWYTRLVVESGLVRGGVTVIPEFIAAMIMESSLDNRKFGDADPDPEFGAFWVQLDSQFHMPTSTREIVRYRSDPLVPLEYVVATDDLCRHTPNRTWFNTGRWNAWEPDILDPPPVDGTARWSPLKAALDAWERVTS